VPGSLWKRSIPSSCKMAPFAPMAAVAVALLRGCHAYSGFRDRIPNGYNVYYNGVLCPGVGHLTCEGGDAVPEGSNVETVSPFGQVFEDNGNVWNAAVCNDDSDHDGLSNGEELGDPNCTWTIGATPSRTTNITHPGVAQNVTTTTNYAILTSSTTKTTTTTPGQASGAERIPAAASGGLLAAVCTLAAHFSGGR
jgi:hypothetical protein